MKTGILSTALLLLSTQAAADCNEILQERLSQDLTLSYKEFDQTSDAGFRLLVNSACYAEAATLIKKYIDHNHSKENSLFWHLAQMYGFSGDYKQAIYYAKQVLNESEDLAESPMYWNDFVLGNIAFWNRDKSKLKQHIENVEKGLSFKPNEMNARYLQRLLANFETSYEKALL